MWNPEILVDPTLVSMMVTKRLLVSVLVTGMIIMHHQKACLTSASRGEMLKLTPAIREKRVNLTPASREEIVHQGEKAEGHILEIMKVIILIFKIMLHLETRAEIKGIAIGTLREQINKV